MSAAPPRANASGAKGLVVLGPKGPGRPPGVVWLVGAGPGDPDLLTVRALNVIRAADVIVHDGLVSDAILRLAPAGARRLGVAKRKSRHAYPQEEISRMLAAFALEGLTVVRLKGGDPFIFGRGGEELEACRAAGVECRVVPGVTAALAAAANAGAPLTHRGAGEAPDLDWPALATANQTVVIYMGLSNARAIAARLIAAGRAPATPALIVENASLATERRIVTTLGALGDAAEGLAGPALLIVGEAMALAAPSAIETPSSLSGGTGRASGLGGARWAAMAPAAAGPTLSASPPVPPHGGEGGLSVPLQKGQGGATP
jgi:uroporphyrin-III C-methyltransferase